MRPTNTSIQPFDMIERSVQKRTNVSMKQPLLRLQRVEKDRKKQMAYGLKDPSAEWNPQQQTTKLSKIITLFPIINPESKMLLLWNTLVQLAVLFNFFMAPLVIFFTEQAYIFDMQTPTGLILNAISVIILYCDLVVRFHMGFYRREKLITSRKQIQQYYLQYQFWLDFLSVACVSIYMIAGIYKLCYIRIAIYLRFPTLLDVDKSIIHNLTIAKYLLSFYKLMRVIVTTWLLTTWAACIFFAIDYHYYLDAGSVYRQQGQLWLLNSQAVNGLDIIVSFPHWYIWYQYALYWSIQTSATTGYGDLTPQNPVQVMYCNIVMLLMTVLFAYYINYVWQIIKQIQQDLQYNENWHECRLYLKQLALPTKHKEKISNYMIELITDEKQQQIVNFIVENISEELKDQYYVGMRKKFYSLGIFQYLYEQQTDQKLWIKLVYLLQQHRVPKHEIIYTIDEQDAGLYYVIHGSVKLKLEYCGGQELGEQVGQGGMFGMYQFLRQTARCHTAVAESFVKIWKLSYLVLKEALKQYKPTIIYQQFYGAQQNMLLYKQCHINLHCWKCQDSHFLPQCPDMCFQHTYHEPERAINQENDYHTQQRRKFKRNNTRALYRKIVNGMPVNSNIITTDIVTHFDGYHPSYNLSHDA